MSQWPQIVTLGFIFVQWLWRMCKDMDEPTPRERFVGATASCLLAAAALFVLYSGGFFK